jgi:sigma-B regulation protein RsbU (phosphoserine phosphatase)
MTTTATSFQTAGVRIHKGSAMAVFRRKKEEDSAPAEVITDSRIESKVSAEHLEIINRILTATRGPYEVPELLDLLVKEIVDAVRSRWGTIKLRTEEGDSVHTMIRRPGIRAGTVPRSIENTAFFLVMGTGEPLTIDDLQSDNRFPDTTDTAEKARALLAVPIEYHGEAIGVLILVDREEEKPFGNRDVSLATLLASEAGPLIENARLVEEAFQRRAMEKERELAEEVWKRFLPAVLPEVEGFELAARCDPAQKVGGDYSDVIYLGDGRTLVALGDVSGSGMPAALLMSNLQAALRVSLGTGPDLEQLASMINAHLCSTTDPERFATLFLGIVDPQNMIIRFVNAGHNPPLLFHADGSHEELPATGIPVGFYPDAPYEAPELKLNRGDCLLIHSDGIPEAFSAKDEMFGDERLVELVKGLGSIPPQEILEAVLTAVEEWSSGSTAYQDDRTLLVLNCC